MNTPVFLTPLEVAIGELVGAARTKRSRERGYAPRGSSDLSNVAERDVQGALGELAVAKAFRVYPEAIASLALDGMTGDVGGRQVRTTKPPGGLPLRPDESVAKAEHVFILVHDRRPYFDLVGWAFGFEVAKKEFWRADWPSPAFCMPFRFVHEIASLDDEILLHCLRSTHHA